MKKFLVPICLILCIIGIFAVWYFGYQTSNPEELKSESKNSLPTENRPEGISSIPESTQKTSKDDTARKMETKGDNSYPEKINGTDSLNKNTELKEKGQKFPSAEDVAAANAFEAYVKAQMEFDLFSESLIEALKASPLDFDHINSVHKNRKDAGVRRKETLQNLAVYSETAAEILASDKTRTPEEEALIAEIKEEIERDRAEIKADDQKRAAESAETEEMRKQINQIMVEYYNILSPEQQRTLLDTFPELKELLSED